MRGDNQERTLVSGHTLVTSMFSLNNITAAELATAVENSHENTRRQLTSTSNSNSNSNRQSTQLDDGDISRVDLLVDDASGVTERYSERGLRQQAEEPSQGETTVLIDCSVMNGSYCHSHTCH